MFFALSPLHLHYFSSSSFLSIIITVLMYYVEMNKDTQRLIKPQYFIND